MFIALTTFSPVAAKLMLAWGTPAQSRPARMSLQGGDLTLPGRCTR